MTESNRDLTLISVTSTSAKEFLDRRVDFERFSRIPDMARAFRLDRMRNLLTKLGNPQDSLPIIHIAGTKGKGSVSAMTASVLSKAGYRVGLFTSPHLERVEERIVFAGRQCSEAEFVALIEAVRPVVEDLDRAAGSGEFEEIGPTYFEILTAMALLHFREKQASAVVLEVGLGGRLDSTNVCLPKLSVITSISFDHTQQLGNTLKAIASEKAGIIKPGVPVISGVTEEEPREEIRRIARQCGSRLVEAGTDFQFRHAPPQHLELAPQCGILEFIPHSTLPLGAVPGVRADSLENCLHPNPIPKGQGLIEPRHYELSLLGRHQAANAAVVLAAIFELRRQGWDISEDALHDGLRETSLPARVEVIARRPTVILDSAHNVASIAALIAVLEESFAARKRLMIFAATKDKDHRAMLPLLLGDFDEIYLTQYASNPRFVPAEELATIAFELSGRRCPTYLSSAEAWQNATQNASAEDLICIAGSFFLAAELRSIFLQSKL
jgi:dihydrofolate synthase / folylpolyglutamate synthase